RERPAEADAGRCHARQCRAEGSVGKKVVTPAARREATTYLRQTFELSERRACQVIGTDRTSVRYQSVRPDDVALRERLKALAQQRRRFGYRRLHVLLRREGHVGKKVVTPAARREATTYLRQTFELSERRACQVIGTDRTSVRYQSVRPDDVALRERLKALAQQRRRFGYRRLHVLLRREGHAVN